MFDFCSVYSILHVYVYKSINYVKLKKNNIPLYMYNKKVMCNTYK